jgi:hypothetical protein
MRLIDADKFILALMDASLSSVDEDTILDLVDSVPIVDVAPVVHGRWEYIPQTLNTLSQLRCPFCGWWSLDPSIDGTYNYCPNCGAKMDGGADHEAD